MSVLDLKPARPRPRSTGSTRGRRAAKTSAKYLWRSSKWVAKQGWRHRVALAPAYGTAATYALALTEHALGGGGSIVGAAGAVGGLALWRYRDGLPLPERLADLEPHERRLDITAWSSLLGVTGLGVLTANVGSPLPMPGVWGLAAIATTAGWLTIRATRPADVVAIETTKVTDIWTKRVATTKGALPDSLLGRVTKVDGTTLTPDGHLGPIVDRAGWTATVELPDTGAAATDAITASNIAKIAKAYRTATMNVLLGYDDQKNEHIVKVTVMTRNPSTNVAVYDPATWQVHKDGCVPVAISPDGTVAQYRVWKPGSGPAHALISGDTGSGKSKGLGLIITQAVATGRVVPIIADPQGGASLPAWGGYSGVAPVVARDPEEIEALYAKLEKVAAERASFIAGLGVGDWDVDTMHEQHGRPLLLVVLDEAHMVLQDPELKQRIAIAAKIWRKVGMGIILVTQAPNLEELGGSQPIRQNVKSGNVISFKTGSRTAAGMILPPAVPDPYTIPPILGKETTEGMCVMATSAPFGMPTNIARFAYLDTENARTEAIRLARDVMPDPDLAASEILGIDIPSWRKRIDEIAAGTAAPDTGPSALLAKERSTMKERILAYLQANPDRSVETAQIIADLDLKPQTVSTSLRRLADDGLVRDHGHGLWQAQ